MRLLVWLLFFCLMIPGAKAGGEARVLKVLPHLLDQKGRHTVAPSLYERDAYQLHLRENPDLISAMRFDVQYKAGKPAGKLVLHLEVRGSRSGLLKVNTFETELKPSGVLSDWAALKLDKSTYTEIGSVIAWRASIQDDGKEIAVQESFLW